ncbi:nuclear transport factor 2 family protein [Ferrovibrio sp.]|uniref:nuclear transport factor 2 family protein n=1 Tax=Ferrovibrio sp. TaxID=1917215 RepID=UPI00311EDA9E
MSDEITQLEDRRYRAMLEGDVAALDAMLAPELVYTHSNAEMDSKASYLDKVGRGIFHYLEIGREDEEIRILDTVAIVTGCMVGRVEVGGVLRKLNNRFVAIWLQRGDKWEFVVYQPTPVPA